MNDQYCKNKHVNLGIFSPYLAALAPAPYPADMQTFSILSLEKLSTYSFKL